MWIQSIEKQSVLQAICLKCLLLSRCRPHHRVARAQCTVVRKISFVKIELEKLTLKLFVICSVWLHWGPRGGVCDSGGWRFICESWPARQSYARHWDGWARPTEVDPHIKEILGGEWLPEQIWECSGIRIMSRENTLGSKGWLPFASHVYFVTWNLLKFDLRVAITWIWSVSNEWCLRAGNPGTIGHVHTNEDANTIWNTYQLERYVYFLLNGDSCMMGSVGRFLCPGSPVTRNPLKSM